MQDQIRAKNICANKINLAIEIVTLKINQYMMK